MLCAWKPYTSSCGQVEHPRTLTTARDSVRNYLKVTQVNYIIMLLVMLLLSSCYKDKKLIAMYFMPSHPVRLAVSLQLRARAMLAVRKTGKWRGIVSGFQ